MAMPTNMLCPGPTHPAVPDRLILARGYAEWCQALREAFAARGNVTIAIDERYAERRWHAQPVWKERRQGE